MGSAIAASGSARQAPSLAVPSFVSLEPDMRKISLTFVASLALWQAACGSSSTTTTTADASSTADTKVSDTGGSNGSDTIGADTGVKVDATVDTGIKKDTGPKDTGPAPIDDETIDKAQALPVGPTGVSDTLDPTGDVDYWKFEGKKGQLLYIFAITAQQTQQNNEFDTATIDTVLTMYGPDKKQYAFDDDPNPRYTNDSSITTVLPADGTYYLRMEECSTWLANNPDPKAGCAQPVDKDNTDYQLVVNLADPKTDPSITPEAAEPNDTTPTTGKVGWVKSSGNTTSGYYASVVFGLLQTLADVDAYTFAVPADWKASAGTIKEKTRPEIQLSSNAGGPKGNGSSLTDMVAWIASDATPTVSKGNLLNSDIQFPGAYGGNFYLFVKHSDSATLGAGDFYIVNLNGTSSNPIEINEAANDKPEGAEILSAYPTQAGDNGYYCSGDIINNGADIDHYKINIPTDGYNLYLYCSGLAMGSGIVNLTSDLVKPTGEVYSGTTTTEKDATGLASTKWAVPAGTKSVLVRLSATGQNASIGSSNYMCGFVLSTN